METRPIPLKSYIIMGILVILGIAVYFITQNGKLIKATRILKTLGYNNISNVKVYGKAKVEDKITRIQGFKYFVTFTDNKNRECRGFILKTFNNKTAQDIDCKDTK